MKAGFWSAQRYYYDAAGNVIEEGVTKHAQGGATAWRDTIYSYDSRNRLESVTQFSSPGVVDNTTEYTYDGTGNVLTVTAGLPSDAKTTTYTYDQVGNVTSMTDAIGMRRLFYTNSIAILYISFDTRVSKEAMAWSLTCS